MPTGLIHLLNQYLKALAVIYPQEGMFLPPKMLIVSERIQKTDRKLYDSQGALGTQKRSPSPPADQAEEGGLGKLVEEVTWADQFQVPIALHSKSFGIFFPLTLSAVTSWQVKLTSMYLSTLSCLCSRLQGTWEQGTHLSSSPQCPQRPAETLAFNCAQCLNA